MQSGNGRGVQQAEVSGAADALLAQGQRPTVERVRRQLGRGSPNTVGPMLETWFAGLATRLGVLTPEADSVGTPTEIRLAMDTLWRLALDMARKDAQAALGAEHDLLRTQQGQLSKERDALARESAALAERDTLRNAALERAQGHADELALQLREMQATLHQRDSELASVRVSLARAVEAKDAAQHEHRLEVQALEARRSRQEERFAATERRHLEEIDKARQDVKTLQRQLADSETRAAAQRKVWDVNAKATETRTQELQTETAALRASLAASEKRIRDLRDLVTVPRTSPGSKRLRRAS